MAKELRIPLAIELPDDIFAQATVLAAVKPALDAFITAIREVAPTFSAEPEIVTPRVMPAKDTESQKQNNLGLASRSDAQAA